MSRMAGVYADWSLSFLDAGNERSAARGSATVLDETNWVDQQAAWLAFRNAVYAVCLGDPVQAVYGNTIEQGATQPTNGASRETKLLVQYQHITTGKRYTLTIPTLNPTLPVYVLNVNAKDVVRVDTPAAITTLISTFNAFVKAPDVPLALVGDIGNTITVIGLKVVGRNL